MLSKNYLNDNNDQLLARAPSFSLLPAHTTMLGLFFNLKTFTKKI